MIKLARCEVQENEIAKWKDGDGDAEGDGFETARKSL